MSTRTDDFHKLKTRFILLIVTVAGMVAVGALSSHSSVNGATSATAPRVTAITQVTHDGYRKTNLLADDSQLYVTEVPEIDRVIAKVALPSSTRSILPSSLSNLQALDLSPDHSRLLVSGKEPRGENEFWSLPVNQGSPQRIGGLSGRDASWSADGKELVYANGHTLYLADAAGTQEHELYKAAGTVFGARFSPTGQTIRFTVSDPEKNTTALWEVKRDGSSPHALLPDWQLNSSACCGNWTSDGRYFIFQASQTLPNTTVIVNSLWALPELGTEESGLGPVPLTNGPMSFGNASVSRDNKSIWAIGVQPYVEVVKYDPKKKKYTPVIPGLSATDLEYSWDGKWVTYVSIPDGTLWRARANGKDRLQLTTAPDRAALPHFSPDGKQIAFASMKPGQSWKLSLVSTDGGDAREMFPESGSQIDANWSSDGTKIMFGEYRGSSGMSIRVVDFKTKKVETIPGSKGFFSPRWSPDGQHIAALSPDNTTLMLFDFQTQKWSTWLQESAGTVNYPVWSSNSQYLYFDDLINGDEAIRRVQVGSSQPELVFELASFERYPGPLGNWSGRSIDGSWMFVEDRSTQEVYQLSLDLP